MQLTLFKNAFLIRDALGYGYHKDLPKPLTNDEKDNSVELQLADLGFEVAYVKGPKSTKAEIAEAKKAGEYTSPDVSDWMPKPPKAPGKEVELTPEEKALQLEAQKGGEAANEVGRDPETKDLLSNDPWHLAAVYDTQEGVRAMFVRKKVQKADTPEERALKDKARAERCEVQVGDRISGHHGHP